MGEPFKLYYFSLIPMSGNLMIKTNKNHTLMQINSISK